MKSKKKILCIIIPCCIAVVALLVVLVLFFTGTFLSPKARVMLALSKTFGGEGIFAQLSGNEDVSAYGYAPEYIAELRKTQAALSDFQENGYSYESIFTLTNLKYDGAPSEIPALAGMGFQLSGEIDSGKQLAHHSLSGHYNFLNISIGELYADDSSISLMIPVLFDGYLIIPTDTFGTSYNASAFPEITGKTIPREYAAELSFSPFELCDDLISEDDFTGNTEELLVLLKDFYEEIEVKKTGDSREFTVGSKELSCEEYVILISEDAVDNLLDSYEDYYEELYESYEKWLPLLAVAADSDPDELFTAYQQLQEDNLLQLRKIFAKDYEIYVYLDNQNRLIAASYEDEFEVKTSYDGSDLDSRIQVSAQIAFHGDKSLPSSYDGQLTLSFEETDEAPCTLIADFKGESTVSDKDAERTGSLEIDFSLSENDTTTDAMLIFDTVYNLEDRELSWEASLSAEKFSAELGSDFSIASEEDNISFVIDDFSIKVTTSDKTYKLSFDTDITYSVLTEEVPTPSGTEYNLFEMNKTELSDLFSSF
ncbi:MAG: hypothetical protein J6K26_12245 [Lachnospiraceae bacterium]|nr:hypothetical protein [Lachnospiraceae bacterium]